MAKGTQKTYKSWLDGGFKSEQKEYTEPVSCLRTTVRFCRRVGRAVCCLTMTEINLNRAAGKRNGTFIRFPTENIWCR